MKKITLKGIMAAAALTLITIASSYAQTNDVEHPTRLGVALGIGVPTKSGGADIILAPDLRLQHDLSNRTSLTLTTGYYGPIGGGTEFGDGLIPLKAGAKFFFGDTYYFQPEVGVGFSTTKNGGNPFIYAPSLGYANNKWDISLRYEGFEYNPGSNGMVAVRLAYAFKRPKK
ncbi:hypothetical protein I5M32_04335 [Pedobacter sp. SD-b]|uniref:Outer membrane protein beta-barrel domain-containing protein n=1 Tax=Pedobacter segetis TaxID=2793069 RepID=A0ABS1BH53_9SPHI|nr:hypothetical protein [Pedobacter segetis]MBK0382180.1 hypothetical protein [Pedobacter segetis]